MSTVFISYRRADSRHWAAKLNDHIGHRYGNDVVFRDVTDIRPGADFLKALARELSKCRVFLVVIGTHWVVSAKGERRLDDAKDILRSEVSHALRSKGTVIPVLVGGATMPPAAALPKPLRSLVRKQAVTLRPARWSADVKALVEELRQLILPSAPRLPLDRAHSEIYRMQAEYFDLLDKSPAKALDLARKSHAYLDRALPLYPQDPELKVTRGYLFKNEAMALISLERHGEAAQALDRGETVFRTMLREFPRDASAWNGLGSVEGVRADIYRRQGSVPKAKKALRGALAYIRKALSIHPDYGAALHDRAEIKRELADLP
jgi:hypothetical protein